MKYILTALTLLMIATPAAMADAPVSTKTERNLVRAGNERFKAGNFYGALQLYDQAIEANPASLIARFNKAVALTHTIDEDNMNLPHGPQAMADSIFRDITRIGSDPSLAEKSFYNLGNMAFNNQNYPAAVAYYKDALRINPTNHATRQNLLLALKQMENSQNNDQSQDQQDQDQQQQQEQQQEQQQQQQQQQQQEMTQSAQQILQTMQNKENATRRRMQQQQGEPQQFNRRTTDKPW